MTFLQAFRISFRSAIIAVILIALVVALGLQNRRVVELEASVAALKTREQNLTNQIVVIANSMNMGQSARLKELKEVREELKGLKAGGQTAGPGFLEDHPDYFGVEPKGPSDIRELLDYLKANGIELEQDKSDHGEWIVTNPAGGDFRVKASFIVFPPKTTKKQMTERLLVTNLAFMLNEKARLAMSFPGLMGTAPDSKIHSPGDEATMEKLRELFEKYRPSSARKPSSDDATLQK